MDKQKQLSLRQVAAHITAMLPQSRDDAHAILKLAAQLVDNFIHAEPKGEGE